MSVMSHFKKKSISDIFMPNKILCIYLFTHKTQNPVLFLKRARFLCHLVLVIYIVKCVHTGNICKLCTCQVCTRKRILRSPSHYICVIYEMFVHTRVCDCINLVSVKPINNDSPSHEAKASEYVWY